MGNGEIPKELGNLNALKVLNLSRNLQLSGLLNIFHQGIDKDISERRIIATGIKPMLLNSMFDRVMIVLHVVIGYADVVTDIFAIIDLFDANNIPIAVANIVIIVFGVGLLIWNSLRRPIDWFLSISHLSIVLNGFDTLKDGKLTKQFILSNKVDAIRSVPSSVLQLYALLGNLKQHPAGTKSYRILVASVALGIFGSSYKMTRLGIFTKAGDRIFSWQFIVVNVYYFAEILLRVLSIGILFISIREYAFIVVAIDCMLRFHFFFF